MEVKIPTVGANKKKYANLVFSDTTRSTYADCVGLNILNEEGETVISHILVKIDDLKRLGKSL